MNTGKIFISDQSDTYLLKFVGDVRLTLSASLSHYLDTLLENSHVKQVIVDMLEAEGADSTTLGLIAKLGLHCRKHYSINVQLFCHNPSILRTLECMGFDEIIDIFSQSPEINGELRTFNALRETSKEASEEVLEETADTKIDKLREQVLESHKVLRQLNPENSVEFSDLIKALESDLSQSH
jgi:anti-anti-sigma factor